MHSFRNATLTDAKCCFDIETAAYEGDEAATRDKIARRIAEYPQGFVLLEGDDDVIGFINSACAQEVDMSDEAFKELTGHDPDAPNVVILSVVVDPAWQGHGHARALMVEFIARMTALGKQTIHLMCKAHHVPMYEKFGYRYVRPSASDHGGMTWHEMVLPLGPGTGA